MKIFNLYSISIALIWAISGFAQNVPNSDEALKEYEFISKSMESSFSQKDLKTYSRESFSQPQLEKYLAQHFQRMDLLPYIEGNHNLKLDSYLHSGNWFKAISLPTESINSYHDFFRYYKKNEKNLTDEEKFHYLGLISYAYTSLAEDFAKLSLLDSAAVQHKRNIDLMKSYNIISYPSALNNYGLFFYWNKKELDSALVYFKKAFTITQVHFPKHSLNGSIRDNIADVYVEQGKLNEAEALYNQNLEFYKNDFNNEGKDVQRLLATSVDLIQTNLKLGHLEDAKKNYLKMEAIVTDDANQINNLPYSKLEFLKIKEIILMSEGKVADSYKILKQHIQLSDSLNALNATIDNKWDNVINNIELDRVKLKYEIDKIQKEAKIKSQRSKLLISSLISSVFIILLLSIIFRRRQHLINSKNKQLLVEQNLENSKLKVEQLNSEIKSKERDLSDFAINLIQNQEWASNLAEKIEAYKTAELTNKKELLTDLEQFIKNKITFDQDTQQFFERLDKLSDAFYSHLMTTYPNLSKNEIQLCSLIRLKMDSRSIATLQNITTASLNTSRYRLRKKLGLSDDVNLDDFIHLL